MTIPKEVINMVAQFSLYIFVFAVASCLVVSLLWRRKRRSKKSSSSDQIVRFVDNLEEPKEDPEWYTKEAEANPIEPQTQTSSHHSTKIDALEQIVLDKIKSNEYELEINSAKPQKIKFLGKGKVFDIHIGPKKQAKIETKEDEELREKEDET